MTTFDASLDYLRDSAKPILNSIVIRRKTNPEFGHVNRNRFLKFLLINALVWPSLAYVGLQISESHSPRVSKSLLKTSGAQSMSANELASVVQTQARPVFWLGSVSGDSYAENSTISGVDVITYIPKNVTPHSLSPLHFVIKTYRDANIFNLQLHPLSGTADTTVEIVRGVSVTYNPASLDHSVITFKNRPQVIALTYAGFQSMSSLMMDAQNLAVIQ